LLFWFQVITRSQFETSFFIIKLKLLKINLSIFVSLNWGVDIVIFHNAFIEIWCSSVYGNVLILSHQKHAWVSCSIFTQMLYHSTFNLHTFAQTFAHASTLVNMFFFFIFMPIPSLPIPIFALQVAHTFAHTFQWSYLSSLSVKVTNICLYLLIPAPSLIPVHSHCWCAHIVALS
jgi:hypothetical protein